VAVHRGLTYSIGDALVALLDWAWPRVVPRIDDILGKVGDAVRPDPPISIRTMDGLLLTGLIVADRGQVLLFVGTRSVPPGAFHSERHDPPPRDPSPRRYPDDGIPPWARDIEVDPYRR
jgi:hypothetical protein